MANINDYTLEKLSQNGTIRNYERSTSHGVINIKYDSVDRSWGAGVGFATASVIGVIGQFGLVAAAAFVPIAGPVMAVSLVTTLLGAPIAGTAAGAFIGSETRKMLYFDEATKQFLGYDNNNAAEKAYEMGKLMNESNDFTTAAEWFHKAYQTCDRIYKNEKKFEDKMYSARAAGNEF